MTEAEQPEEGRKHEPKDNDRPGYTGTRYEPVGVVHRGEYFTPDGEGGMVHAYTDNNELIYHYSGDGQRMSLRYEGTDIGYAILLNGGREANITITSEKHGAGFAEQIQDTSISNREDRSIA